MRVLNIVSAIFVFTIIFITFNAEADEYHHVNLTVEKDQTLVFDNDQIWLYGDILIDGHLVIKDSNLNVNRTLDWTTSEIRINPGGQLDIINTTISTMGYELGNGNETLIFPYTLVSDAGNLTVYDSTIYYGMIWLVGGNAEITGLALDGFSMVNYGIFSEDTNLTASGVNIRNYTLGLRSIGKELDLESIYYYNCSTRMTQEWWVTFSAFDESTGLPIIGFESRQWDGERMVGSWNWAKQYEIDNSGQIITHQTRFTFYLNFGFGYIERSWEGYIDDNLDIVEVFNLNHTQIAFESGIIFVNGNPYIGSDCIGPCEKAPKFSEVNFSVSIANPTDINFNNLNLNLLINAKSGYAQTSISLPSNTSKTANVTWRAFMEGPLSLTVEVVIVDFSSNSTEDYKITLNRFLDVEGSHSFIKSEGSWAALLAIFVLMSLCSYIIYTGMEDESEVVDSKSSNKDVEEDEKSFDDIQFERDMAISQETDDAKEN